MIHNYQNVILKKKKILIISFLCTSIFLLSVSLILRIPYQQGYAYLSVSNAMISISVFIFFISRVYRCSYANNFVAIISQSSFGIYLIHPFILEQIHIESLGGYTRFVIACICFGISFLVIRIISLLPHSKYVV